MKTWLTSFALHRPVTVLMVLVSVVGLGAIAWTRMPLKFLPSTDFPVMVCMIPYSNATPSQVEQEIAIPVEGEFQTIPHLERIETVSDSNGCRVSMLFKSGTNMADATAEVRDRLERLKLKFPDEVDQAFLYKHSSDSLPIMMFVLFSSDPTDDEFWHLVQTVVEPRLKRIEGVAEVQVMLTQPEEEVLIEFDQNLLKSCGVSLYDVIAQLQTSNLNVSVGEVEEGNAKYFVRVLGEVSRPEELANLVVGANGLRLKSLAEVGFASRAFERHYDIDGKGGAIVMVLKESEANTVATCERVRAEVESLGEDPILKGVSHFTIFDQAELIAIALKGLMNAGRFGALLAVVVLFLFMLRIRPTIVVALAIPTSLVCAVVTMFFLGMTLNLVTIMGLIVAVGLLVDNSIVVIENIQRYKELGLSPHESSLRGASEVGVAIMASTATTMVVFLPVIYMESGEMAIYMKQFAVPMATSLLASLGIALTLIPLAMSRMKEAHHSRVMHALGVGGEGGLVHHAGHAWDLLREVHPLKWIIRLYAWCLDGALRWRLATVLVIFVLLVLTYLIPYQRTEVNTMPDLDMRLVEIHVNLEQNIDMIRADDIFGEIKEELDGRREELDIKHVFTQFWPGHGIVQLHLRKPQEYAPGELPPYTTDEVLAIVSELFPKRIPGAKLRFVVPAAEQGSDGTRTVRVRLKGDDNAMVTRYAERFKTLLELVPGLYDVHVGLPSTSKEVQLRIDEPRADQAGVSPLLIARTVDIALRGARLPFLKQGGREFAVWAQFREEDRKTRENLDNVTVMSPRTGQLLPLTQFVEFTKARSPAGIQRMDGKNTISISAKVSGEDLSGVLRDVDKVIASLDLPQGYSITKGEQFVELEANTRNYMSALLMAVILIYLVMSALFESMILPLSILISVPLAFVGAYWFMFLTHTPFEAVAFIGCILMVGVIVNNGIVIVDHINFLRMNGVERHAALVQAGRDRFRPVMMTALTTILGCVPLAIHQANATFSFMGLGRTLIGGLITGTILTLVVVPVLYVIIDDLREWTSHFIASLISLGKSQEGMARGEDS